MPAVFPFKALRPAKEWVRVVAAPPYDVVDGAEADRILASNPSSFIQVEKTAAGIAEIWPPDDDRYYGHSLNNLKKLIRDGKLIQDRQDCFYLYRLASGVHSQLGLVCCLPLGLYESGMIRKHESTRPDKELDRTRHIVSLAAQTGPIFIAHQTLPAIDGLMGSLTAGPPLYDFTTDDGVEHKVWVVADPGNIEEISRQFGQLGPLYIVDGHHRAAAAAAAAEQLREGPLGATLSAPRDSMLSVLFPHNQLQIMPYNRVAKAPEDFSEVDFFAGLEQRFLVAKTGAGVNPQGADEFLLYHRGDWYHLQTRDRLPASDDPLAGVPAQILQEKFLAPLLGITDPRSSDRIDFIGGIRGVEELERLVDSGRYDFGISLYPAAIGDMMRTADAGLLMPPKSTWFEPKLRSGIFTRLLTGA